ncbi:MAG: 30S ribosomal protein S17 [Actinobacteria bacterium]|nr:30S ribosomal protein S17 [Actinomycetota bacterium]
MTAETPAAETTTAETAAAARVGEGHSAAQTGRNYRKTRQGYVVSDKMDKTVVVTVEDRVKHALYGKVLRRSTKVKAHDEENSAGVGDLVQIMETRPLSATKRWRVVQILQRAK